MKRLVYVRIAIAALAGLVACSAQVLGQPDGEATPIFGIRIPAGCSPTMPGSRPASSTNAYWIRHRGQGRAGGDAAVPGRRHRCPDCLEVRTVAGKRGGFRPAAIPRRRGADERSVHGQGFHQIRIDRRLGLRAVRRRETRQRGGAQRLLRLPCHRQGTRLRLQPLCALTVDAGPLDSRAQSRRLCGPPRTSQVVSCLQSFAPLHRLLALPARSVPRCAGNGLTSPPDIVAYLHRCSSRGSA